MITIPAEYRKRYGLGEGSKVSVIDINGHLEIIPVLDIEQVRVREYTEYVDAMHEARVEELELEERE